MNIANKITFSRVLAVPVVVALLYFDKPLTDILSLIVFFIASSSDYFDGYYARKYNLVTDFGKVLDPVADKIMITCTMLVLVKLGRIEAWLVAVMVTRDFVIGALRDLSSSKGFLIAAGFWGKAKTFTQMFATGMLMYNGTLLYINWTVVGTYTAYAAAILSVYSGYVYIREYFKRVKTVDM